jgi:hypothetical protein
MEKLFTLKETREIGDRSLIVGKFGFLKDVHIQGMQTIIKEISSFLESPTGRFFSRMK